MIQGTRMQRNETHSSGRKAPPPVGKSYRTPLGLDVRLHGDRYLAQEWTPHRRELYLLRPDVEQPISVDRIVWPSVFLFPGDWANPERADPPITPRFGFAEVTTRLWRDRSRMDAALREHFASDITPGALMRIDLVTDASDKAGEAWKFLNLVPEPLLDGSDQWPVIGYDVADSGLRSGLMNCGYSQPERQALRPAWAPKINGHGLFTSPDDAFAFRAVTTARAPEHAPFFVFAIAIRGGV
jgi:hypothetical protein